MYTEVAFAQFLESVLQEIRGEFGIEFDQYPNVLNWPDGQWIYEIVGGFNVKVFRWPTHKWKAITVSGPDWDHPANLDREIFEPRFMDDFRSAVMELSSKQHTRI